MSGIPARHIIVPERLGLPKFQSPLRLDEHSGGGRGRFIPEGVMIRHHIEYEPADLTAETESVEVFFEKAGPRRDIYFDPLRTRAAIVTCGGLCPGLNTVIRSLFLELHFNYGVRSILGIRHGYRGLVPEHGLKPIELTCDFVSEIHKEGGTMLGTSRGPQALGVMVDFLESQRIDILYCLGGDGTQRGAHAITTEASRRGLQIAVVGIPKTIDNDLSYCDKSFGFLTAVEEAAKVIHLAHTEARSTQRGVGLVKLMGRHAGFIACEAARACQQVNFVLIPEVPFGLDGPEGVLAALDRRLDARDHAIIVVAEGAGQHLFRNKGEPERDASGNAKLLDIGPRLQKEIQKYFEARNRPVVLKYMDPSYLIRSVPPTIEDQLLCDDLARRAAHAGMSGRTGVLVSTINNAFVHVPIAMACDGRRQVELESELWSSVLASTGQPPVFR